MTGRAAKAPRRGWYCPKCGALYSNPGSGFITCQQCGGFGLRGFDGGPPKRVTCNAEGCEFTGWADGGINDDLPRHKRREHANG